MLRRHIVFAAMVATALSVGLAPSAFAQEAIEPIRPVGNRNERTESRTDLQATGRVGAGGRLTFTRGLDLRLGPFRVRPAAGAAVGVESFAFARAQNETGIGTGLGASLFVTSGPSLDIVLPIGSRHVLSASGSAAYTHNLWNSGGVGERRRDRLDGWSYFGSGGYGYSGSSLNAATTYTIERYPRSQLESIARGPDADLTDIDERVYVLEQTAGAEFQVRLGARSELQVQGTRADIEYERGVTYLGTDLATVLNRREYRVDAYLNRRLGQRTTAGLFARARRSGFDDADSFRNNWNGRAGFRAIVADRDQSAAASQRLSGRLELGTEFVLLDDHERSPEDAIELGDAERDDFFGLFAQADVRYQLHPRIGLTAQADFSIGQTFWEENTYYINEGIGGGVNFRILRSLSLGGGVTYARQRFPEPATIELADGSFLTAKREDDLFIYRGVLGFRLFGQELALEGGYFERDSNFPIVASRGYFVRLGFGVGLFRQFRFDEDL